MRISTLNIYMRKVFNIVHRSCCFFVDLPRIAFHLHLWVKAEKRICRWTSFIAATLEMPPRSFPVENITVDYTHFNVFKA